MLPKQNLRAQNEQPPMPMNDETARYLWNLTQKSNLTVTTALPAKPQVKQEKNTDPVELKPQEQDLCVKKNINPKEANKINWKDKEESKQEDSSTSTPTVSNPFAALPLSLIKNGILSVTSDSACVKIENGIPILKETTDKTMQPCLEQKSAITIEPVLIKAKASTSPIASAHPYGIEKPLPKLGARQYAFDSKIEDFKPKTAESSINSAHFQRKMLLQHQILKTLMKQTGVQPLPSNTLIPNSNQMEFAALLGLEIVTQFCLSEHRPMLKSSKPDFCSQCGTDFSPRWHICGSISLQKLCERCFFWHMRLKNTEERIKQYKIQAKILQKSTKLAPAKVRPQLPVFVQPQMLFKNYLSTLIAADVSFNNSYVGFSDLTKLGASIAANLEVNKAMESLRSLNSTATPEVRAKAIQNLQLAFYKGLTGALKTSEMKIEQQDNLLQNYQLNVAQLAQRAGFTIGPNTQGSSRRTGIPLEVFERAIKEHKQRLLKTIQTIKN